MRALLLSMLLCASACKCRSEPAPTPAVPPAPAGATGPEAPAPARASRFCDALNGLPDVRRADCCGHGAAIGLEMECPRYLIPLLESGTMTLATSAVNRCASAMARVLAGCDWVGPNAVPLPLECRGVLVGTREEGGACQSSLACRTGLFCLEGQCARPRPDGAVCGAQDALARLVQQPLLPDHPECEHVCEAKRCVAATPLGGPCDRDEPCGRGHHCAKDRCADGPTAALGAPCAPGGCAPNARCIHGACAIPKNPGSPCADAAECLGACLLLDAGAGTCGTDCTL